MKSAKLEYFDEFPWAPMSGWCGARSFALKACYSKSGQPMRPENIVHPFITQRKKWCRLSLHFRGVNLCFVTPKELDTFIEIMSMKILPSGDSLIDGQRTPGRPNNHWLSRLPKGVHALKFRTMLIKYLREDANVQDFREFYENAPVRYEFEDVFNTYDEALDDMKRKLDRLR